MAQIFAAFGKFSSNNKGSVQNFGIVGITIASEEITKFIFFFCPCNILEAKFYGYTFIFGPAAILLVVGYLVNRRTWRLTTGLCNRTQGVGKGCKRLFHFIFIFANITTKALIAPGTWIVISLLKGDYYACANWPDNTNIADTRAFYGLKPSNDSLPLPCQFKQPKFYEASDYFIIARDLSATSHLIGWWMVAFALMLGVVLMFVLRCYSKYSYEQNKYITSYRKHEVAMFEQTLDDKAKEQAQKIVEGYFTVPRKKEEWDQIAVINDKVTKSKRGRPIYSPLHKFVNRELLRKAEENGIAVDYGLVGDAAEKKRSIAKKAKAAAAAQATGTTQPATNATNIQMMPMIVTRPSASHHPQQRPPTQQQQPATTTSPIQQETNVPAGEVVDPPDDITDPDAIPHPELAGAPEHDPDEAGPDPIRETNLLDPEDSSNDEADGPMETTEPPNDSITEDYSTNQGEDEPLINE